MNKCKFFVSSSFLLHKTVWRNVSPYLGKTPFLLNVPPFREKGHSKWQNIRHIKEAKDQERSKIFAKYVHMMKLAIVEGGGSDPALNSKLAHIIDNAQRHNMPNNTIQKVLNSKDKPLQAGWFELKGPKGCVMYISGLAPQISLVKQGIRSAVRRLKVRNIEFADRIAKAVFEYKGLILAEPPPGMENVEETSLEHAIEVGAEEVYPLEDIPNTLEFITPASGLHKARNALNDLKYVIKEADCVYIPKTMVELDEEEEEAMRNLYDEISKMPEVVSIYTNF